MNKVEYLFGFGTEGVEKVFADALFAVIVLAIVAFALGKRMAAAKERKQEQARHPAARAFGNAVKQANPSVQAAQYAFEAARAMTAAPGGQIHLSSALPGKKPPHPAGALHKATAQPSGEGTASSEGTEGHAPGFHGERLKKVDLGALRAQENAHTADNLTWKAPEETVLERKAGADGRPSATAAQLRQAVVMKEILDAPVSRRRRTGRTYGR